MKTKDKFRVAGVDWCLDHSFVWKVKKEGKPSTRITTWNGTQMSWDSRKILEKREVCCLSWLSEKQGSSSAKPCTGSSDSHPGRWLFLGPPTPRGHNVKSHIHSGMLGTYPVEPTSQLWQADSILASSSFPGKTKRGFWKYGATFLRLQIGNCWRLDSSAGGPL